MTALVIEQTKDRAGHHAWKVIRQGDVNPVGRIEWLNGQHQFTMRGYMPSFTATELHQLAEFIEEQS